MGASQSKTRLEGNLPIDGTKYSATETEEEMPSLRKTETFEEKLYRKCSEEPLVPIGCAVTAYFLGSGISSFLNRDSVRSQKMMRLRVASQMSTIFIFIGYAGYSNFNWNTPKSMMPWKNEDSEEKK